MLRRRGGDPAAASPCPLPRESPSSSPSPAIRLPRRRAPCRRPADPHPSAIPAAEAPPPPRSTPVPTLLSAAPSSHCQRFAVETPSCRLAAVHPASPRFSMNVDLPVRLWPALLANGQNRQFDIVCIFPGWAGIPRFRLSANWGFVAPNHRVNGWSNKMRTISKSCQTGQSATCLSFAFPRFLTVNLEAIWADSPLCRIPRGRVTMRTRCTQDPRKGVTGTCVQDFGKDVTETRRGHGKVCARSRGGFFSCRLTPPFSCDDECIVWLWIRRFAAYRPFSSTGFRRWCAPASTANSTSRRTGAATCWGGRIASSGT